MPASPAQWTASRPRSARARRRVLAALVLGVVALIATVVAVVPVGLMYGRVHPRRAAIDDDPSRHGLEYADVAFASPLDGTTIRGWYLPASQPTGRAIVVAPGIDDNRLVSGITLALAPSFVEHGFDVLAFDFRAEGASDGDLQTFGAAEQWDVLGAVAEARRHGARSVGVLGFSLGAAATILAAARSPDIVAVVADSAFADLADSLHHELTANLGLPEPIGTYGVFLFEMLSGVDPSSVVPVAAIGALGRRPVLLVQGGRDRTVPPAESSRLLAAAGPSTTRWLVPGGEHAKSYFADPAGYARRVVAFFEDALDR